MVDYYIPSWNEIEEGIFYIGESLVKNYYIPDVIVAVLTGGVIPAKLLSDLLDIKNIRYIEIKFYRNVGKTENKPVIKSVYTDSLEGKNVLVVDDVSDTGETLEAVSNVITMFNPTKIMTATLYLKPWSKRIPDFYYKQIDKWIVFPWDKWDVVRENRDIQIENKDRFLNLYHELARIKK
ncbi:phosphoribosyltransferase [Sulfolobus sp. A20]|uniref:phosphoribosyltransferase n=1 Tax=Saccharolobus sp. A20 TaxID=1891280 RepID=UPI000845ECD2|nr:phosphoribosyltransferase [Sulfolobus sp. A20]TRM74122.1 phosphoribosyltransferase [Sulfolobus sp. E5]TRM78407.1 phosphoribosyltransferase [Sulfolobus sp. A20-N-F8]TRM81099.1 phosphoribosyltransferase [Sulfolobus sp. D5]TRM83663.1 phosphoribosyltransferase [Sulfolobus sp. A20-N-F6]TRM85190.1 phosphoribosyltransferase [Sulfolobus sp. F3]TRM98742.1 phosphoribosyltransferase [Sulfolobus sp. F1]TRM99956.1 phosphoribosyltransferase [Sulfolobus sp. E1]